MDMMPRKTNHIWIEATTPGTYLGACYELCGVQHAWMRLQVVVRPLDVFNAWQHAQRTTPRLPRKGLAAAGAQLFQRLTCTNCHMIAGTGAVGQVGPDLTHLAKAMRPREWEFCPTRRRTWPSC